ncbi:MAG: DedA family protein [Candidatus Dormibacteraeota bacterium]|nr:DedA family protein [Candidatus Dormibacteraeota bacterium]
MEPLRRRWRGRRQPLDGRWLVTLLATLAVVLALLMAALLEGDIPDALSDVTELAQRLVLRFGPVASLLLLYLEESGVPLPVPGDVYVAYLGHLADSALKWVVAWLGIIAVVVAGASNLYLISRRWGRRLVQGRLGAVVHLTPARLATAERWFARWGALAIIFGRHVPGFRVPITVAVGIFRVSYPTFAASVAISTAVWAAVWLWLGARFGTRIGHFLASHRWTYLLFLLLIIALVVVSISRLLRAKPASVSEN